MALKKAEPVTPEVVAPKAAVAVKVEKSQLVQVLNLTATYFVQPSTGIRIAGKEQREMKADGWLENQINAKLLKRA